VTGAAVRQMSAARFFVWLTKMSRIGKKPVILPQEVKAEQQGRHIKLKGPRGSLEVDYPPKIKVVIDDVEGRILVENRHPKDRQGRQLHGTIRALIANMVSGVSTGFQKRMEIYGTGYNIKEQGGKLILQVGFSDPVELVIPNGIKVNIEVGATKGDDIPAKFTFSGIDKCQLGQFAADVRRVRPPEPYKGKGIRYADEQVRHKVGKAFTSGAV
jgi:large subunit ribosomal protein L6